MDRNKLNRILNKVAKSQLLAPFSPYGRPDFSPIPYGLDEEGMCHARGTCCEKKLCDDYLCKDKREYLGSRDGTGLDDDACRKLQLEQHRKFQSLCEEEHNTFSGTPSEYTPCRCHNNIVTVYTAQETCENIALDDEPYYRRGGAGCKKRTEGREPIFDVSILPEMCRNSDEKWRKLTCEYGDDLPDCDCDNESVEDCALRHKNRCMQTTLNEQDKDMRETLICDCEREYLESLISYYKQLDRDSLSDIPECSICRQLNDGYRQELNRYQAQLEALEVRCTTIIDDNPEEDESDDPSGPRPPTGPTQPTRYP